MANETFCPECGFGVRVDEDGCCVHCGSVATGGAVAELYEERRDVCEYFNEPNFCGAIDGIRK